MAKSPSRAHRTLLYDKLKAAIFDVDGTLVDSVDLHAEAWQRTFQHYGRDIPFQQIRAQIGKGGDQLLPVFFSEDELEKTGKEMENFRNKLFKNELLARVKPFPKVRELFERMRSDYLKIALASSGKEEEVEHHMELLNVKDLVEISTTSEDAAKSKPHPDIFAAALKKLDDLDPHLGLAIGDTPYDAEAAGKIGLRTVGVLCGGFSEADIRGGGAIDIYQGPSDLLSRYDQSLFHQI